MLPNMVSCRCSYAGWVFCKGSDAVLCAYMHGQCIRAPSNVLGPKLLQLSRNYTIVWCLSRPIATRHYGSAIVVGCSCLYVWLQWCRLGSFLVFVFVAFVVLLLAFWTFQLRKWFCASNRLCDEYACQWLSSYLHRQRLGLLLAVLMLLQNTVGILSLVRANVAKRFLPNHIAIFDE